MSHQSISTNDQCNLQCIPTFAALHKSRAGLWEKAALYDFVPSYLGPLEGKKGAGVGRYRGQLF